MLAIARDEIARRFWPLLGLVARGATDGPALRTFTAALGASPAFAALAAFARRSAFFAYLGACNLVAIIGFEDRPFEINAGFRRENFAKLVLENARLDLVHSALFKLAQLERAVGHANEAVHGKPEMLENALDLSVLAFAQAHREPHVGALHAVDLRLNAAILNTLDDNARGQRIQLRLIDVAVGAHAIAAQPAG